MNKIVLGLIVAIVVIGGVFVFKGSSTNTVSEDSENNTEKENFTGSLKDLYTSGKDVTCDFHKMDQYGEMDGTIYVKASNKKFRGDFMLKQQSGQSFETHVINDGSVGYTWGVAPEGTIAIKFAVEENNGSSTGGDEQFNEDETLDYKCGSWNADESKFTPPNDIMFQDFSNMKMMGQMQGEASVGGVDCSACDLISDPSAKSQCLSAIGC